MQIDSTALICPIRRLVELLVKERYEEIEQISGGCPLTAAELRQAVSTYGRKLTMPPDDAWKNLSVVEVKNAPRPAFSVRFDLWANGKRSDLSLETTLKAAPDGTFQVEVDDLHVL